MPAYIHFFIIAFTRFLKARVTINNNNNNNKVIYILLNPILFLIVISLLIITHHTEILLYPPNLLFLLGPSLMHIITIQIGDHAGNIKICYNSFPFLLSHVKHAIDPRFLSVLPRQLFMGLAALHSHQESHQYLLPL